MEKFKVVTAESPTRDVTLTFVQGELKGSLETRMYGSRPMSYPEWDYEWHIVANPQSVRLLFTYEDVYLWVTRLSDGAETCLEARGGFQAIASNEYESLLSTPMKSLPMGYSCGVNKGVWTAADASGCLWYFAAQVDKTWAVWRAPGYVTDFVVAEEANVPFTLASPAKPGLPLEITFDDEMDQDGIPDGLTVVSITDVADVRTMTKDDFLEAQADILMNDWKRS